MSQRKKEKQKHTSPNAKKQNESDKPDRITVKQDALDTLDRTIGFVRNCDNKASIFTGFIFAVVSILIKDDGISIFRDYVVDSFKANSTWGIILSVGMVASSLGLFIGLLYFVSVLTARLRGRKGEKESLIYFNSIYKQENYEDDFRKETESDYISDIIDQIMNNSIICNKKYSRYKVGVILSTISLILILVLSQLMNFIK